MNKLALILLVTAAITGLFFAIGPPNFILQLLMEIPQYQQWMQEELEQAWGGGDGLIGGAYQAGCNMRIWTILMSSAIVSFMPCLVITFYPKRP